MNPESVIACWERAWRSRIPLRQDTPLRRAAVLAPLVVSGDGVSLLFTKRTKGLASHAGEVSFPGGGVEAGDESFEAAALRETEEEIGIPRDRIRIIARMDDEITIASRHIVAPFIGVIDNAENLTFQDTEVSHTYLIPFHHFLTPEVSWKEQWAGGGRTRPVFFYRYQHDIIWGLTGRIVAKMADIARPCFGHCR